MPTISQCQILNSLLERKLVTANDVDADVTTNAQPGECGAIAIISDPGASNQQAKPNGLEQDEPLSALDTSSLATADQDITGFQIHKMQTAVNTTQMVPMLRPNGLWKTNFNSSSRSALYLWNIRNKISQKKLTDSTSYKQDAEIPAHRVNNQAFSPWRVALSQRHLLISPVLDNMSPSPKSRQRSPMETLFNTVVGQNVQLSDKDEDADGKRVELTIGAENIQGENKRIQDHDSNAIAGKMKSFVVAKNKKMFDVKCSENVKDQLYQLGWRRPRKKRKAKKKEETCSTPNPRLSLRLNMKLDLATDPVLMKLSRKSKNMIVQSAPPEKKPRAVCFDIVGAHLTHLNVWRAFQRDVLSEFEEVKLESIQFSPRSIFVARNEKSDPVENRWVITLTSQWFRNRVAGLKIHFGEFTTHLRRYDDVADFEFRQYTRMTNMVKMVNSKPTS